MKTRTVSASIMKPMRHEPWLSSLALLPVLSARAAEREDGAAVATTGNPLLWLALLTLGAGILFVCLQLLKVRKAKRENTHSALSRGNQKTEPGSTDSSKRY